MLARRGVNPFRIQSLGRWKSPLVIHYAGEAMSVGPARELTTSPPPQPADSSAIDRIRTFLDRLDQRILALESVEVAAQPPIEPTDARTIIHNPSTNVYHSSITPASTPIERRKTKCGWKFATQLHTMCPELPGRLRYTSLCPRCLFQDREVATAAEQSDID